MQSDRWLGGVPRSGRQDDQKEISTVRLRKWYADMLTHAASVSGGAIKGFKNVGDAIPDPKLTEIPYFDGDNWPDIIEDILKLDNRQLEDEQAKIDYGVMVEKIQMQIWEEGCQEARPKHTKPRLLPTRYEGCAPPKAKKRRKSETSSRQPKQLYTIKERLKLVIDQLKRDFLVVELHSSGKRVERDPDLDVKLPKAPSGIASFLRAEKLE